MSGRVDVLIAGGGMVGASLAAALAPSGLGVMVVEAIAPSAAQPSFDDRATALSATSKTILATLGLWDGMQASEILSIHVSDQGRFGSTRLDAAEARGDAFGYVIENRHAGDVLWRALRASGCRIECPASVVAASVTDDGVDVGVRAADGKLQTVRAGLLVVAEGANSATRELLGAAVQHSAFDRSALVMNIATGRHHAQRAFERFTPDGPLAVLPLGGGRCNVVWSLPPALGKELAADDVACRDALQSAFGFRLGRIQRVGSRVVYPLRQTVAAPLHGARWVLLGNAAHSVHPVAGQGFNLGLRDMATLAELLSAPDGRTMADTLARYASLRRPDQQRVLTMTNSLVRAFSSSFLPLAAARDAALVGMQLMPFARDWFADLGMGLAGPLPRLARGVALS